MICVFLSLYFAIYGVGNFSLWWPQINIMISYHFHPILTMNMNTNPLSIVKSWSIGIHSRNDNSPSAWMRMPTIVVIALQWHLNWRYGVSNHQPYDCLLNRLFWRRSEKTSTFSVTGHCVGNSPVTGEFPAQMTSNAENVSIWWRHHWVVTWTPNGKNRYGWCQDNTMSKAMYGIKVHAFQGGM